MDHRYAVILAGGGGTRLWPKSRHAKPKHLLNLFGEGSLIKLTYENFLPIIPKERIIIVTLEEYADLILKDLPGFPKENIICEPEAKNTAMAMGVAAAFIRKRDEEAVIIHEAADHLYEDLGRLHETVLASLEVAAAGDYIVAIGIRPTFPHTGLGYIRIGDSLDQFGNIGRRNYVFAGKGFKEKPHLTTAQSFLASGQYLWNANLYSWSVQTIFKAFFEHSPQIFEAIDKIYRAVGTPDENKTMKKVYSGLDNPASIDYEVSEKAKNIVVIPGNFGWSDIGDWKVVYDTQEKDQNHNVVHVGGDDNFIGIDSEHCLIEGNSRLIATLGVEDLVIVDTPDALLVCHKNRSQDVKKIVEKLKELKKDKVL